MTIGLEQPRFYFSLYPPVGEPDWQYTYASAQIRAIEDKLFSQQFFTELANAKDIKELCEMLAGTDYAVSASMTQEEIQQLLVSRRMETRKLFEQSIDDQRIIRLFRARIDFANMRLAIRRLVTEKPLGTDYSYQGNVQPEQFELAFEQEDYSSLPEFLQQGVEDAVLAYYNNKNIQDIDFEIDRAEAEFMLTGAREIGSIFLVELFRMQNDLTNIRTMMRLKFLNLDERRPFLPGGYIEKSRFIQCFDIGYEALAGHFYATPYYHLIEAGANYLEKEKSFLKLEAACDDHFLGFLKTTRYIAAGTQPIIAYLLLKKQEIRMVRMVLTCKKAQIDPKVIQDRISV